MPTEDINMAKMFDDFINVLDTTVKITEFL